MTGASSSVAQAPPPTPDIINGTVVPNDPAEWPFIVALLQNTSGASQYCGGSLIRPRLVVTAAHCVDTATGGFTPGAVLYGRKSLTGTGGEILGVASVHVHPAYNAATLANDIALIKLSSAPAIATTIQIATASEDPAAGSPVDAAGWGSIEPDGSDYPIDLYEATLASVSNFDCGVAWGPGSIFTSNTCASSSPADTCFGDSGGPLVSETGNGPRLVGLTSWGSGPCAQPGFPGVYTRVSSFLSWISGFVGRSLASSTNAVNFATVPNREGGETRTIRFTSTGDEPITVHRAISSLLPVFMITRDGCGGVVLHPGAICEIDVRFYPFAPGNRSGVLTLLTNGSYATSKLISLTGVAQPNLFTISTMRLSATKRPRRIRRSSRIRPRVAIKYRVPRSVSSDDACDGRMRLSLAVSGIRKRYVRRARLRYSSGYCVSRHVYTLPVRALRKRIRATATFSGNQRIETRSKSFALKLR